MKVFDINVHKQRDYSPETKLQALLNMCTGKAYEAIHNCEIIEPPEVGYHKARDILARSFGSQEVVMDAHMAQLTEGPPIKMYDSAAIRDLANKMSTCSILMKAWESSNLLDNRFCLKKIFNRLPYPIRIGYADSADDQKPTFEHMLGYVTKLASSSFGFYHSILEEQQQKPRSSHEPNVKPKNRQPKVSVYAADITTAEPTAGSATLTKPVFKDKTVKCPLCENLGHVLYRCTAFKGKSINDRQKIVKEARLCFNCLRSGHIVANCKSDRSCSECGGRHHSMLHREKSSYTERLPDESKVEPNAPRNESVAAIKSNFLNMPLSVRFKVVPVTVSHVGSDSVKTYAFLDEGSSRTLCSDWLLTKLGVEGEHYRSIIKSVHGSKTVDGRQVSLKVRGFHEKKDIVIPNVLSVDFLPEVNDSIPTIELTKYYDHLSDLYFPNLECRDIDLLIGADVLSKCHTSEIREGPEEAPTGYHTPFGWAIMGPDKHMNSVCHRHANFLNIEC